MDLSLQLPALSPAQAFQAHSGTVLAVLLIGLFIVVLIYTVSLFLTLEERISAPHAARTTP